MVHELTSAILSGYVADSRVAQAPSPAALDFDFDVLLGLVPFNALPAVAGAGARATRAQQ